jgi:hypothetical protein
MIAARRGTKGFRLASASSIAIALDYTLYLLNKPYCFSLIRAGPRVEMITAAVSTRNALAAYEAKVTDARAQYSEACKLSAALPEPRRANEKDAAFRALKDTQQRAMRALVAIEFAELIKLRPSAPRPRG